MENVNTCTLLVTQLLWETMALESTGECTSAAAAAAKSLQSCLTLCDPRDSSPPGSPVPGILQARTMEWGAICFSSAWKWKVKVKSLSLVRLLATPWTAAYQAPPSMEFSRQEYWSGVTLPSPMHIWCESYLAESSLYWTQWENHIKEFLKLQNKKGPHIVIDLW